MNPTYSGFPSAPQFFHALAVLVVLRRDVLPRVVTQHFLIQFLRRCAARLYGRQDVAFEQLVAVVVAQVYFNFHRVC